MAKYQRVSDALNYKISIDLEKKINRNQAFILILIITMIIIASGYYVGERWFWVTNKNYYENRADNIKKILKDQPQSENLKAELAINQYLSGQTDKAQEVLREILSKEPGNEVAALYLGLILSDQKEYNEAVKWLTKFVEKNQGLETRLAYLYLGQSHLALANYKKAAENLEEAAKRDPGNPVVYYYLGQTYEKLNKTKSAKSSYEKALSIANNYTEADMALKSLLKKQK